MGLSDTLWELLEATWVVRRAHEPQAQPPVRRRPPASTVLDRLKRCVNHWGESIAPIIPASWEDSGECRMSQYSTATGPDDDFTVGGNTMASDSRDRIGHPVVDVDE